MQLPKLPKHPVKYYLKTYATITLGCILFAISISFFFDPFDIPAGGVSGVALLLNHFFPSWDTGVLYFVINIPILILGLLTLGLEFAISTVYATTVCSLLTLLCDTLRDKYSLMLTDNLIIAVLVAGALMGAGMGLIFRMRSSTGGADVIVKLLRKKFRHIKTGVISLTLDVVIISLFCIICNDLNMWLYGILMLVTLMIVFDYVLYAANAAKLTYIITTEEYSAPILDRLLNEIDTGATIIEGKGAYTGNGKKVILCACKPVLFPKLRDIVYQEDSGAFLIVSSAQEIYGENFQEDTEDL